MQQDLLYKTSYRLKPDALTGAVLAVDTSWDYYHVEGGTTITSLASVGVGMQVVLDFKANTTITHSATIVLPENKDINAVIGDVYRFVQLSTTEWKNISGGGTSGGGNDIDNTAYGASWNGDIDDGASKNALYDKIETLAGNDINSDIYQMMGFTNGISIGDSLTGDNFVGTDSVLIGEFAAQRGAGAGNVVIGYDTAELTVLGEGNTIIGRNAAQVDGPAVSSVVIGDNAGSLSSTSTEVTNIDSSVIIGSEASPKNADSTNEIVIGANATGNGDNTTTIGSSSNDVTYLKGRVSLEMGLNRGQITFPLIANPSAYPQTLDDYEEGTFTPSFQATGATFGYSVRTGAYVKIGGIVHFSLNINLSSISGGVGASVQVTGLPFVKVATDTYETAAIYYEALNLTQGGLDSCVGVLTWMGSGNTYLNLNYMQNNSVSIAVEATHLTSTSRVRINGSYRV